MASDAVELADRLVFTVTGRHLNDLQRTILHQVWQGQKYLDIANTAGYTEGHIKDVAYQMWRLLSRVTGEKVTKSTLKSALKRSLRKMGIDVSGASAALGQTDLLAQPEAFQLASSASLFKGNPVQPTQGEDLGSQIALTNSAETSASTAANPNFVGRQEAIAHLHALIAQGDRPILIKGEGGLGKTTLAQHFVAEQPVDLTLELLMAKDPADITPVEWVVE